MSLWEFRAEGLFTEPSRYSRKAVMNGQNIRIIQLICTILDKMRLRKAGGHYRQLITFVQDRPGHNLRYAIDATKIEKHLGWKASVNFESGILKTIDWYLAKLGQRA